MLNPYTGRTFFGFFIQLFHRIGQFLTGNLGFSDLATDEIQILVLVGVAISAAFVGTFLILKRMTMLANSLSHTILFGIVIAFFFLQSGEHTINLQSMLIAAFIMGILTAFLTEFFTKTIRLQEDASTGLVFTTIFALGIILVTVLTRNAHIGIEVVMGNVDALHLDDIKLVYGILLFNLAIFFLFFKEFKLVAFDSALAKALGFSPTIFNYLLMVLVSATAIAAFRAVGVLMVLAFITGPVLTARLLTHRLKSLIGTACLIGSFSAIFAVALTRHLLSVYGMALATSGVVVSLLFLLFLLTASFHLMNRVWFHSKRVDP